MSILAIRSVVLNNSDHAVANVGGTVELTEQETMFIDGLVADTDALLATEEIVINESVDTLEAYVAALNMILSEEDLATEVQESLALGIALLEKSLQARANKAAGKSMPYHKARIAAFHADTPEQQAAHKAANKEVRIANRVDKLVRRDPGALDRVLDAVALHPHQEKGRQRFFKGAKAHEIAQRANALAQFHSAIAKHPDVIALRKARAANKPPAAPEANRYLRKQADAPKDNAAASAPKDKKASNESVDLPSVDDLMNDMAQVLEQSGYELPNEFDLVEFIDNVIEIIDTDTDLTEETKAFLELAVEATVQGLDEEVA